jgi:hypothetical protein
VIKNVMARCDQRQPTKPKTAGQDGATGDLILGALGIDDVVRLIEDAGSAEYLGSLAARLVELGGGHANGAADGDNGQIYAHAMRRLQERLGADPTARQIFARHPRTYGRPAEHLVTSADDWVVPMVETAIGLMPSNDKDVFCQTVIMRVGRQQAVHPDFRPLLLDVAKEPRSLDRLATGELTLPTAGEAARSYLLAAVAAPFVDVIMTDADDGTELEAAAWTYAQEGIARTMAEGSLEQAVTRAASLLARIDNGRELMARHSPAHRHAGLATKAAVAEFVITSLVLLAAGSDRPTGRGGLDIGAFVLREPAGRAAIDVPQSTFESWARNRTPRHLLLDLATIVMLTQHEHHGLPPLPSTDARTRAGAALEHLRIVQRRPAARMAIRAIDSAWPSGSWAGAA